MKNNSLFLAEMTAPRLPFALALASRQAAARTVLRAPSGVSRRDGTPAAGDCIKRGASVMEGKMKPDFPKKNRLITAGVLAFALAASNLFTGCLTTNPLSDATIAKYGLRSNVELFKSYQYYVSRDIVLTNTSTQTQLDIVSGQARSDTRVERDVRQILSSTSGVALDVRVDDSGTIFLGIAFFEDDNLLWFAQDPAQEDSYFYLVYADRVYADRESKSIVEYGGRNYVVSYDQASGVGASLRRVLNLGRSSDNSLRYENREPLLLYAENAKVKETERRRTAGGRRL